MSARVTTLGNGMCRQRQRAAAAKSSTDGPFYIHASVRVDIIEWRQTFDQILRTCQTLDTDCTLASCRQHHVGGQKLAHSIVQLKA